MNKEKDLSRITIDISQESHKQLKVKAAMNGQSMRDIVVELISNYIADTNSANKKSLHALEKTQNSN